MTRLEMLKSADKLMQQAQSLNQTAQTIRAQMQRAASWPGYQNYQNALRTGKGIIEAARSADVVKWNNLLKDALAVERQEKEFVSRAKELYKRAGKL
jgi:hypothetical protein